MVIYPAESAEPLGNWLMSSVRAVDRWIVEGDTENQFNWQKARAMSRATRILWRRLGGGHELLRTAHLAAQWGADIQARRPRISIADDAAQVGCGRARHWQAIAQQAGAEGIIGIVPAGTLPQKSYPVESWKHVLHTLWQQHRLMPALLGTPAEASAIADIRAAIPDIPMVDLADRLEVLALTALLGRLDAVIGVDTGTIHLALAQQVPTVILRTGAHVGRFIPWPGTSNAKVLPQHPSRDAAANRIGRTTGESIASIDPSDVVEACLEVSGRRPRLRIAV
jgi:ADP-heptose:LPS heptosyltransferase